MQKNHFLLLKILKNTESAQLWTKPTIRRKTTDDNLADFYILHPELGVEVSRFQQCMHHPISLPFPIMHAPSRLIAAKREHRQMSGQDCQEPGEHEQEAARCGARFGVGKKRLGGVGRKGRSWTLGVI